MKYIYIICVVILIFFYVVHSLELKRVNNDIRILQSYDPDGETILKLFKEKLPLILMDEINLWILDEEDEDLTLLNKSLGELKELFKNKDIHKKILSNLNHYALPLSKGWDISLELIKHSSLDKITLIRENIYMHLIGCLNGEMRVILFPPNTPKTIINDTNLCDKIADDINIKCIEIIIRVGNIIYIPYGWLYYIYSYNKTIVISAKNTTYFCII